MSKSIKSLFRRSRSRSNRPASERSSRGPAFSSTTDRRSSPHADMQSPDLSPLDQKELPTDDLEALASMLRDQLALRQERRAAGQAEVGSEGLLALLRDKAADERSGAAGQRLKVLLEMAERETMTPFRGGSGADAGSAESWGPAGGNDGDAGGPDVERMEDTARAKGKCEEAKGESACRDHFPVLMSPALAQELLETKQTWSPACREHLQAIVRLLQSTAADLPDPDGVGDRANRVIRSLRDILAARVGDIEIALLGIVELLLQPQGEPDSAPASPVISDGERVSKDTISLESDRTPTLSSRLKRAPRVAEAEGDDSPGISETQALIYPEPAAAVAPEPPATDADAGADDASETDNKSVFSYRGHRLTRSALELVLAQEALAQADSSGQYAGPVSFDEQRGGWIPDDVKPLGVGDTARGEVPDTDPATYTPKREDQWGNRIGFRGGRMFYLSEEPEFKLPDE